MTDAIKVTFLLWLNKLLTSVINANTKKIMQIDGYIRSEVEKGGKDADSTLFEVMNGEYSASKVKF